MILSDIITFVVLPLLLLGALMTVVRFVRGPNMSDRIISVDKLATLWIGIIAAYAISTSQPVILDATTVIALTSFLGTVAFAYYAQKRRS